MSNNYTYCQQIAKQSRSNFYYSFMFLPLNKRKAITAIYAFCRNIDDIVDKHTNLEIATQKLVWWQDEIERVYSQNPQHPIGKALTQTLAHYPIKKLHFLQLIEGMYMDLNYKGYSTFADLKVYCHCVASTVGMLATEVFGYNNATTLDYAKNLGIALQLVNIIRDVGEDARAQRIYIPEELMHKHNLTSQMLLELPTKQPPQLTAVLQELSTTARNIYQNTLANLAASDRKNQLPSLIMAHIYFTLLTEIERSNFTVLHQKTKLPAWRQLWLAWRTYTSEKQLHHA